jgi:hypothetical protein
MHGGGRGSRMSGLSDVIEETNSPNNVFLLAMRA